MCRTEQDSAHCGLVLLQMINKNELIWQKVYRYKLPVNIWKIPLAKGYVGFTKT